MLRLVAVLALLVAAPARAESLVWVGPGPGDSLTWERLRPQRVIGYSEPARLGWAPLDQWLQVAPKGTALAASTPHGKRLVVWRADGTKLVELPVAATAMRFSPTGGELAVASRGGLSVVTLADGTSRQVTLAGVDLLRWSPAGLVARQRRGGRDALYVVSGRPRLLARAPRIEAVVVGGNRLVYFVPGKLVELDLVSGAVTQVVLPRKPVTNAEISPDGTRLLFAAGGKIHQRVGAGPVTVIAAADEVHSLLFAPDGTSWLWASRQGGALIVGERSQPLPAGLNLVRYRQDGPELILSGKDGIVRWNPTTDARESLGGLAADEGMNVAGDHVGGAAVLFTVLRPRTNRPPSPPP